MKIRAIRLAECGRFADPIALDGLCGGLNVLVGPNELGKSTLLRAMQTAFFTDHKSRQKDVVALRPYQGGAPLIEVEFEAGGHRWRLMKRFLAQPTAELVSLDDAHAKPIRGADAEIQLAEILGGEGGDGRFPLLWVSQGGTLDPLELSNGGANMIRSAIAREVETVAGGEPAREVLERARKALAQLVTEKQRKPTGVYGEALAAARKAVTERDEAATTLAAVRARIDTLGELRAREAALSNPSATAAREAAFAEARTALSAGKQAQQRLEAAALKANAARGEHEAARRDATVLAQDLADLETVAGLIAADTARGQTVRERLAAATRDTEAARTAVAGARQAVTAAEAELLAEAEMARRQMNAARLAELEARLAAARAAEHRRQHVAAGLALLPVSDADLREARRASQDLAGCKARLDAIAATLHMAYLPGAKSRITVDGRELADGERLQATSALALDIEGVGTLTVAPGVIEGHDELVRQSAALQDSLASVLRRCRAGDVAEIEARLETKRALTADLAEVQARLDAAAPQGLVTLEATCTAAASPGGMAAPSITPTRQRGHIELDLGTARQRLAEAERALNAIDGEMARLREDAAGLTKTLELRSEQRQRLDARLPPTAERAAQTQALAAKVAERLAVLNAAERERTAWAEQAPSPEALRTLEGHLASAEQAIATAVRELGQIANDAARIEGELQSRREEDVESRAALLADIADETEARAADIAEEAAALRLLIDELEAAESAIQDRFLAPVTARLKPYLESVFPGAALGMDASFGVATIARNGLPEDMTRLSAGTREQIAVLTRLAFAGLLSDAGHATPLILDDALVYSDDERIAAMFGALQKAAAVHQVIILSCRTKAFESLGGTRVAIKRWAA